MAYTSLDDFKQKTGVNVSAEDAALINKSPEFANEFYKQKDAWLNSGGDVKKQQDANYALNNAREAYGNFTGGTDGMDVVRYGNTVQTPNNRWSTLNSQLNGLTSMIREGTDAQVAAQRKQQELARYQAQKQKEGVTAGYYAGLGALNEAAANNGYSSLGGQSRSEQANAVSQMTQAQNNIENTLQTNIAQIESNIANLVQQGRLAEAEQQFNNLQFLKQEEQRVLDNQYRNDAFEWQKQNDLFNRAIAEGNLTGVYNGLPTLAKQQLVESIRQFDKTFDENVRQFGLNYALQEAQLKLQQQQLALSASRSGGSGGNSINDILSQYTWHIENGLDVPPALLNAYNSIYGITNNEDQPQASYQYNSPINYNQVESIVGPLIQNGNASGALAYIDGLKADGRISDSIILDLVSLYPALQQYLG